MKERQNYGIVDYLDSENPRVHPGAIVSRFLYDIDQYVDWHLHIIRHFDQEHADDRQMQRIREYFQTLRLFSLSLPTHREEGYEMTIQLFHCRRDSIVIDEALFFTKWDSYYNEYRISGLRIIDPRTCRIKKTIFHKIGIGERYRVRSY